MRSHFITTIQRSDSDLMHQQLKEAIVNWLFFELILFKNHLSIEIFLLKFRNLIAGRTLYKNRKQLNISLIDDSFFLDEMFVQHTYRLPSTSKFKFETRII